MGFLGTLFGTDGVYKKARKDLEKAKQEETSYYRSLADMDFTQSSANQAALKQAREMLAENTNRIAASAAVSGASAESVAAQKAANNASLENIATNIAANSTANKQAAMDNYIAANRHYTQAIANSRMQQANAETQAMSGLLNAGKDVALAAITGGK